MKQVNVAIILSIFLTCFIAVKAHASRLNQEDGILPNHSAEYVRTLNRFASIDADAAFYNPAGLAFMKEKGLTVMFSGQVYSAERIHAMDYYGIKFEGNPFIPTSSIMNPAFGLPDEYTAETLAPCLPDLDIVYKGRNWAVFFDLSVMQAAPGMTFNKGLAVIDWGNIAQMETLYASGGLNSLTSYWRDAKAVRTEYYVGATVGGSFAPLDWLSVALAVRYIYATGNQNITVKYAGVAYVDGTGNQTGNITPWLIDVDVNGHGAGIIFGLDFKPLPGLNIGLKYEYYPPMILKKKTNRFFAPGNVASSGNLNIFLDSIGKLPFYDAAFNISKMNPDAVMRFRKEVKPELKVTYPQTLSFGLSYNILKNLRIETSAELSLRAFRDLDGREDMWNVGYKVGQCIEWTFIPRFTVSAGYLYNDFGIKMLQRNEVDPLLTSHTVGGGFTIDVSEWFEITIGAFYVIFVPEKVYYLEYSNVSGATWHALSKNFDEKRLSIAIGLTARLFGGYDYGLKKDDSSGRTMDEKLRINM